MNFKGSGPVLFVLLAVVFIVGTYAADYQTFRRQHYDNPRSNGPDNDTKNNIISVCGSGGEPYGTRLRRSKKQFSVTTFKLTGASTRPPCNYRENKSNRYIVIACDNNLPVHYDEGQI
ncbi:angiogenin-2-like [Anolis carolinensis]|uniref:angiogenin-2-like n=1 Tax=Anolis carolinensis TaxID=28377 RepID=UPI002F2B2440